MTEKIPYTSRELTPVNADLPRSASVPAVVSYRGYVASMAKLVYYWGYPFVDVSGRTGQWQLMKEPGTMAGFIPAAPMNQMGYVSEHLDPDQRWVVSPNNDTIYSSCFANLGVSPVVVQTPTDVPDRHYWTLQVVDAFTNVVFQLGSSARTPGGKFLMVGPEWDGEKPEGFIEVLRIPTNVAWLVPRSFMAPTPESRATSLAVLGQINVYPLGDDQPGLRTVDPEAISRNGVFPAGLTPEALAADPEAFRPQWVNPATFWEKLEEAFELSPTCGPDDQAMADQARTLLALYRSDPSYKTLLEDVALEADTELRAGASYVHSGVDNGNGWQRQENSGVWGTDWFGRAQAAVIYIMVNDNKEAIYWMRATDAAGTPFNGRNDYTIIFPKDELPPLHEDLGGFWSLTMYSSDLFMITDRPNGRTNIGTVNLRADQLKFNDDGSLTVFLGSAEPADEIGKANWLPAPAGAFALLFRTYIPQESLRDGSYLLPNVVRGR